MSAKKAARTYSQREYDALLKKIMQSDNRYASAKEQLRAMEEQYKEDMDFKAAKLTELSDYIRGLEESLKGITIERDNLKCHLEGLAAQNEYLRNMEITGVDDAHRKIMTVMGKLADRDIPFMMWRVTSDVRIEMDNKMASESQRLNQVSKKFYQQEKINEALSLVMSGNADFLNLQGGNEPPNTRDCCSTEPHN